MQCCSFKCNLHDSGVKGTTFTGREAIFKKIMGLRTFRSRLSHAIKRSHLQCTE